MSSSRKHSIYAQDSTVWIETGYDDALAVLQRAMDQSGFLVNLEAAFQASPKPRHDFAIAIKPNIMTASKRVAPNPVYTSPEMVEYLIDRLHERGFRNISVVESHNVYDYSYAGRRVQNVAAMVGYTERNYRVVNLSEEKEPYDYGSVLGEHYVGRTWRDANYRISFAKNKSHWQCLYTGCLKNVYGCLPEGDKMRHYHGKGREFYECCILIADRFPVHFGFLDAWYSGDGFSGHVRDPNPNFTRAILASPNIFALDWVMGEKMDLNPSLNYVLQEGLYRWGPIHITRRGNMTSWSPWTNIRPFVIITLDALEEVYGLSKFFSRSFASQQDPRFPPVSKAQWFFGLLQGFTRLIEGVFETKT